MRPTRLRSLWLGATLILLIPILLGAADPSSQTNEFCPILPDEEALEEFAVEFQGKTIYLCCRSCVHQFEANPTAYLHALPQFAESDVPRNIQVADLLAQLPPWQQTVPALLLLVLLLALEWNWRRKKGHGLLGEMASGRRFSALAVLLLLVTLGLFLQNRSLHKELTETRERLTLEEREKLIHNNTFADYGFPPVPIRPPTTPRLRATFYRGNDERNEELFNGGNYRTATFQLELILGDGTPVEHGMDTRGEMILVRLEIQRAPHTPDFFFEREIMEPIFLTRQHDRLLGWERPVADRVSLTELEHLWRWEARFPIGRLKGPGVTTLEDVIYVGEEWAEEGRMIGASLHYGIQYALTAQEGVISEDSDLWMGSLFRPRKTPLWRIPLLEWFSHEPIPELPGPNQVDDPEVLGISDYVDGDEG